MTRGNVIVVPIGDGLLYTQPIYLDTAEDSLPTLYLVVVSFGDSQRVRRLELRRRRCPTPCARPSRPTSR